MSSTCKLFIPNSSYNTSDFPSILKAVGGDDLTITVTKAPQRDNEYTSQYFAVEKAGHKASVYFHVIQRHEDLSKSPDPSYYGIGSESEPPEFAKGLAIYTDAFGGHSQRAWAADLVKKVWEKQGGYLVEDDGLSDDYVVKAGTDAVVSPVARSKDIAAVWATKMSLLMRRDTESLLSPEDAKQLAEGFEELASSLILNSLDKKREQQIELVLTEKSEPKEAVQGPKMG